MPDQISLFPDLGTSSPEPCFSSDIPVVLDTVPASIMDLPVTDIEERIFKAKEALKWLISHYKTSFSTSFGKDSSCTLGLAMAAAAELAQEGATILPFTVLTADTTCENPAVAALADGEITKVIDWINRHSLPGSVHVARPALSSQFAVSVIGGRSLPSLVGTKRDCTTDWKSVPLTRLSKKVLGKPSASDIVVSVTGVRRSESLARAANLELRGESDIRIVGTNQQGRGSMAPIIEWNYDDVFEYLGLCASGLIATYSNMAPVIETYRDALGECVMASSDSKEAKASKPCSARFGCWTCLQVKDDRSMDQMVTEPKHAYMRPLANFRTFLKNTFYDLSRRTMIGRSVDEEGYIRFAIDAYSPPMLQELLKYALTIDIEEREAAAKLGIAPRFQIVSLESLLAISAQWSLQGYARPFTALAIYRDILRGQRFPIPETQEYPKVPIPPAAGRIFVGREDEDNQPFDGLYDVMLDAFGGDGCLGHKDIVSKGQASRVMDVNLAEAFSIDPEGASLFEMFEMDRHIDEWHNPGRLSRLEGLAIAGVEYRVYVSYGLLSLAKGKEGQVDRLLKRTARFERLGLAGYQDNTSRALALSSTTFSEKNAPAEAAAPTAEDVSDLFQSNLQRMAA